MLRESSTVQHPAQGLASGEMPTSESDATLWKLLLLGLGLSLPMTNVLFVPAIQGTLPAFFFAALIFSIIVFQGQLHSLVRLGLMILVYLWILGLAFITNLSLSQSPELSLNLIGGVTSAHPFLASSVITQMPYLLMCFVVYCVFRAIGFDQGKGCLKVAAWFYVSWGLYDWAYFLLTGSSGDFMTNRTFGYHSSSWVQTFDLMGVRVLRFKSMSGEPSMTVLVLLPLMYLFRSDKKLLAALFLCSLLTFSLSVYCCVALYFLFFVVTAWKREGALKGWLWVGIAVVTIVGVAGFLLTDYDFVSKHFIEKAQGYGESGRNRFYGFEDALLFFSKMDLLNMLFGIGFGTTYYTLMLRLLVDCGMLGVAAYLFFCLRGSWHLPEAACCFVTILIAQSLFTSELFYPVLWGVFGTYHARISELKFANRSDEWVAESLPARA